MKIVIMLSQRLKTTIKSNISSTKLQKNLNIQLPKHAPEIGLRRFAVSGLPVMVWGQI
jgi:hypothetical protein